MLSRFVSMAALSAALTCGVAATAQAAPQATIEDFQAESAMAAPVLSPSGRYLAMVRFDGKARAAVVVDLQTNQQTVLLSTPESEGVYFDDIVWKGEDRLLVSTMVAETSYLNGDETKRLKTYRFARGVLAMNRDGSQRVALFNEAKGVASTNDLGRMLDTLDDDPGHVLMTAYTTTYVPAIWKVDVKTGKAELVEKGTEDTDGWWTDKDGVVVARWDSRAWRGWQALMARAPGETEWTEVLRIRPSDYDALRDFEIVGAAPFSGQLYVYRKPQLPEEGDTAAIHSYDFKAKKLGPALWRNAKYDLSGVKLNVKDEVTAVCYVADYYQCDYTDPKKAAAYRGLQKFFGNERAIESVSTSNDERLSVFAVSGPDEPLSYYLYDWTAKKIDLLGTTSPRLPPEKLGRMEKVSWKTRDGVEIGGYLTVPPGAPAGPLPLVVIPHGGPESRDSFTYDRWAQFVATRGYAVFQPNFRGSGGFGRKFAEAGYGEWGGLMQNDVEDGVQALIEKGRVDPKRMCVFGASYGGYVALYAGASAPDRYKCVISFAGVSDLRESVSHDGEVYGLDSETYKYWLRSIGDPRSDRARLDAKSPVKLAEAFKAPVLLVHGDMDRNVPLDQSENMEKALKRAKKPVRLLKLKEEGHGGLREANEKLMLEQIASFLTENLGAGVAPTAPAAKAAP